MNVSRMWQELWLEKYTWNEGDFMNGILVIVICIIYTSINGHKKSIVPKNDNLAKHRGKRTRFTNGYPEQHLSEDNTYVAHNCQHLKFCKEWASHKPRLVVDKVEAKLQANCKREEVQISTFYEVLNHGRSMIDYERSESLLKFHRVKNMPSKHWFESTCWEMNGHFHLLVLE